MVAVSTTRVLRSKQRGLKWRRRLGLPIVVVIAYVIWCQTNLPDTPSITSSIRAIHSNVTMPWPAEPWRFMPDSKWCRRPKADQPGLIYVKIPKTGSSTMVGINLRIARKVGERSPPKSTWWPFGGRKNSEACSASYRHGRTEMLERNQPFLLWSFLRDPSSRALSEFYHFEVSRKGRRPSNLWAKTHLGNRRNYQFLYLADHTHPEVLLPTTAPPLQDTRNLISRYILEPFHFIGLIERKLESLAVLKLLWNLEAEDLIVLSAKTAGGYDDGRFNGTCIRIQQPPNPLSSFLKDYIATEFRRDNIDYILYEMVNETLDKTIASLGADNLDREMRNLRRLQALAETECQSKAIFPCSLNGTLQMEASTKDCYWTDSGCGHQCVDHVLKSKT